MRDIRTLTVVAAGLLLGAQAASAQSIYAGAKSGSYYGTLCPAMVEGLKSDGFTAKCVETDGSIDNIQKLLDDPSGIAMVQTDAFADWSQANPDAAKQLLPVRSDLASESVYLVSKNLTDFADVVRFVTRIKLVLPPKDSGPVQTFDNLKHLLPQVFGKIEDSQITYAPSAAAAIDMALANDNTVALFVQLPDPANPNFKTIISKKGHFVPLVAQALLDQKLGDQPVYTLETRPVKAAGIIASAVQVTTLATPITILVRTEDATKEGTNARTNYDDMVKKLKSLPREKLLPKSGPTASLFSRTWHATSDTTKSLLGKAEAEIKKL
jgi:hypothetical protein